MSNAVISSSSGVVEVKTGTNLQLTDTPTNDNQAGNITYHKSLFQASQYLGNTIANAKVTVSGSTITLSTQTGAISSTNPIYIPIPLPGSTGFVDYQKITSAKTLTLPSGTINQRVCGINTIDGQATFAGANTGAISSAGLTGAIEWFLYYVYDSGASANGGGIGISRSPLHTFVPSNYFYNSSASTITLVGSGNTAWDAMILPFSGAITAPTSTSTSCVCLGPVITAIVDGGGSGINGAANSTAGRFSSVTLTSNFIPRWGNKLSSVVKHQVWADTANGFGSTDTKIRKFTNNPVNAGTAVQYLAVGGASAANSIGGGEFVFTEDGVYSITYTDNMNGGYMGLSLNGTTTTNVQSLTISQQLCFLTTPAVASAAGIASFTDYFSAGSIVRCHTNATAAGTNANTLVRVSKIGWKANT